MPPYASPHQRPAAPLTSPPVPYRRSQLRTPVPPPRPTSTSAHPPRHGLGRPSHWAMAVAALLVGLLIGLVWAGAGGTLADPQRAGEASASTASWARADHTHPA